MPDIIRILPVLLSRLNRPLQLVRDDLAQVFSQLAGAAGQIVHRSRHHLADLLDMVCGLGTGVRQLVDLLSHDGKSGPRRARPGRLNGGVDRDEVGGGRYAENVLGQYLNLLHAVTLFNGLIQHGHDGFRLAPDHLGLRMGGTLHPLSPFPHFR